MARRRRALWWETMLPAGIWLLAARAALGAATLRQRLDFRWLALTFVSLRLSSRLFRTGFRSWRHQWGAQMAMIAASARTRWKEESGS